MNESQINLEILDFDQELTKLRKGYIRILWRGFSNKENIVSITKLTEDWADELRKEYFDWIHQLGNINLQGKSLIQILRIRESFSAWWLGLLVEKSNFYKSTYINEVLKILALNKWINNREIRELKIYTKNKKLKSALNVYCQTRKIKFKEFKIIERHAWKLNISLKKIFFSLPFELRAFIWFVYKIFYNLPLINVGLDKWQKSDSEFLFVSYLFNMKNAFLGKFNSSSYWGNLPEKLNNDKKKTSWIHIFVKDNFIKNAFQASKLIKDLNLNNSSQVHVTLYSFLNFKVVCKVIRDWLKIYFAIKKFNLRSFFPKLKGFNVWEFYQEDIFDSFVGNSLIDNLLSLNLFEEAFKNKDRKAVLSYLLENQGWEIGMLAACNSKGFKKIIGFSHATIRYWDLRNFYDKRDYFNNDKLKLPRPNILAVNSKNVYQSYLDFGYPTDEIKLVEALRHLYLHKIIRIKEKKVKGKSTKKLSILVLGDYLKSNTNYQLKLLNDLPEEILNKLQIIFKPHPACNIDKEWFPNIKMQINSDNIANLISESDIAYCSSSTSAAVDAYSYGKRVIVAYDPTMLNFSPLRGFKEVSFVKNSTELKKSIFNLYSNNSYPSSNRVIFEVKSGLSLWEDLLYR